MDGVLSPMYYHSANKAASTKREDKSKLPLKVGKRVLAVSEINTCATLIPNAIQLLVPNTTRRNTVVVLQQ